MALALRYAASSHVGLQRDLNEDAGYAGPQLLVVADGMGGHVAGEVASATAVAALTPLDSTDAGSGAEDREGTPPGPAQADATRAGATALDSSPRSAGDQGSDVDGDGDELLERLAGAVRQANDQLRAMMRADASLDGMGTTLTAVLRSGTRLGVAHIGDSRGYLLRDHKLLQITRDHTFVQSLVDEGRISAEQAEHHPQRALILRVLDGRRDVDLDLSVREVQAGDRYLLCSDGLSGCVDVEAIRTTLTDVAEPADACRVLVELALRAGGPDNITCVVADAVEIPPATPTPPQAVGSVAEQPAIAKDVGAGAVVRPSATSTASGEAATSGGAASRHVPQRPSYAGRFRRARSAPRWPGGLWRLALLVVTVLLVAGAGYAGWAWSQQQYYVGADGDSVAIFRGVSSGVSGGVLSSVMERQDMPLTALPTFTRERVSDTIPARDLEHARTIVGRIHEQAVACAAAAAPASSSSPATSPTAAAPPATPPSASASASAPVSPPGGDAVRQGGVAAAPSAAPSSAAGISCEEVPL